MTVRSGLLLIAAALLLLTGGAYTEHGTMLHYALAGTGIVFLCLGMLLALKARRAMHHSVSGRLMERTKNESLLLALFAASAMVGCVAQSAVPDIGSAPHADIAVSSSPNTSVLVYATAPSAFALRGSEMRIRSDTIRATTPVNLTAFLNAGDIHVVAAGTVPIEVKATLTGAPATRLGATGRRIVLESGGAGIR